jgi:hypothetical protein
MKETKAYFEVGSEEEPPEILVVWACVVVENGRFEICFSFFENINQHVRHL